VGGAPPDDARSGGGSGAIDRWTVSTAEGVAGATWWCWRRRWTVRPGDERGGPCPVGGVPGDGRGIDQAGGAGGVLRCCRGGEVRGFASAGGSEARGIEAARADLYQRALVLVTPTAASDEATVCRVEELWRAVAAGHSESTRPPMIGCWRGRATCRTWRRACWWRPWATKRRAGVDGVLTRRGWLGDPAMWRDIFMTNRDEVLAAIGRLRRR